MDKQFTRITNKDVQAIAEVRYKYSQDNREIDLPLFNYLIYRDSSLENEKRIVAVSLNTAMTIYDQYPEDSANQLVYSEVDYLNSIFDSRVIIGDEASEYLCMCLRMDLYETYRRYELKVIFSNIVRRTRFRGFHSKKLITPESMVIKQCSN